MDSFDKRAGAVHETLTANNGNLPSAAKEGQLSASQIKDNIVLDLKDAVKQLDMLRAGSDKRRGVEVSLDEFVKDKWGFGGLDPFYNMLGINPAYNSIHSFMTTPEFNENYKWLVPEIIRAAVKLGLEREPLWRKLIRTEEAVTQPTVTMPAINQANVPVRTLGEQESIPTGTITFQQKKVSLVRVGTGIKITDQVNQYTPINLLSIYLQDVGLQLGLMFDKLAINTLINGDQDDASEAAAVIGVDNTTTGFAYRDLLRAWLRLGRIGRTPTLMLSNENPALDILELDEFKGFAGDTRVATQIKLDSPIPSVQNYAVHGAMPINNQIMLIDTQNALIKLNAGALRIEADRIVEKGLNATYIQQTSGFATLFRDARLIIDKSLAFGTPDNATFPTWMNNREANVDAIRQ